MSYSDSTPEDKPLDTASTDTGATEESAPEVMDVDEVMECFRSAYRAKKDLLERQRQDFLFALGQQWDPETVKLYEDRKIKAVTDNRIQPNIFLLTGLERQNRSDFKAFPVGEEDSLKAEIASALLKDSIKKSDYGFKGSDTFKDGVTCGEAHLDLYLDNTDDLLNGKPCWKKRDSSRVFPEPGYREYDYSDARYVDILTTDISKDDLENMFPEKSDVIQALSGGKIDYEDIGGGDSTHVQEKDYPKKSSGFGDDDEKDDCFDLIEHYYKKPVKTFFIGDYQTGQINQMKDEATANQFIDAYHQEIMTDQVNFQNQMAQHQAEVANIDPRLAPPAPVPPPQKNPDRYKTISRNVMEIWYCAVIPGMKEVLVDERAWFYPKWKSWPVIPFYARFSTADLPKQDRHLLVQGIVRPVKDLQEKHNKAETLKVLHLQSSVNSGWLSEEDSWVDASKVENFGSQPGVNLEFKKTAKVVPQRISPVQLSQAHTEIAAESVEAIKGSLGINSDLIAVQQGGSDSGRAIALRQRQGLLMVQEIFDNYSRTKQICGRFLLSQLGEIYDTQTAMKILGDNFLQQNFPPPMVQGPVNPVTGQPMQLPAPDANGQPMTYNAQLAEAVINDVLSGDLEKYDVTVGEAVASDTMRVANAMELQDLATKMPGVIPPDLIVEESQLPASTKNRILGAIKNAQANAALPPPPGGNPPSPAEANPFALAANGGS